MTCCAAATNALQSFGCGSNDVTDFGLPVNDPQHPQALSQQPTRLLQQQHFSYGITTTWSVVQQVHFIQHMRHPPSMTSSFGSVGIHKQRCVGLCVFGKREKEKGKKRERKAKKRKREEKEFIVRTNTTHNHYYWHNQQWHISCQPSNLTHDKSTTQTKKKRVLEEI